MWFSKRRDPGCCRTTWRTVPASTGDGPPGDRGSAGSPGRTGSAARGFARTAGTTAAPGNLIGYLIPLSHLELFLELNGDVAYEYMETERVRADLRAAFDQLGGLYTEFPWAYLGGDAARKFATARAQVYAASS